MIDHDKPDSGNVSDYESWCQNHPPPLTLIPLRITHPALVARLAKPGADIASEMTPGDAHLMHMVLGISGEAGELLDAIKKKLIYRKEIDRENVVEELGDLEFFLEGLRQGLGITRDESIEANIRKLSARYPGTEYSNQAATERKDKVFDGAIGVTVFES